MLWWLAQNALAAAVLAVIVAAVCRLGRFSPPVRHALWLIVLVKFLTPPLFTWPWSPAGLFDTSNQAPIAVADSTAPAQEQRASPAGSGVDSRDAQPVFETAPETANEALATNGGGALETDELPRFQTAPPSSADFAARRAPSPRLEQALAIDWQELTRALALWIWTTGTLAALAVEALRILRFRRLLQSAAPAPRRLRRSVHLFARQLGVTAPSTILVPGLHSPMIWAFGWPRLLWPAEWLDNWDSESRQSVIIHELAHLRRRDHWVRWLELAAGCVWWWHPAFWWVRRQLRQLADWACDAWVIWALPESRRAYAEALIEVSALATQTVAPAPALGVGDARQAFQRRLTMILCERVPRRAPRWGLAAIALAGLATIPCWSFGQTPEIQHATELKLELQRLRAELEKTRAELEQAKAMIAQREAVAQALPERPLHDAATEAQSRARFQEANRQWQREVSDVPAGGLSSGWSQSSVRRPWGPEQATGAPDTPEPGDQQTAWASRTPDDEDEWLQLDYGPKVQAVAVLVFESHNPGAVSRISVSLPGNHQEYAWNVKDPTPVDKPSGVSIFPIPAQVDFSVTRVRLEVASRKVPGWNEIDAVGLLDTSGKVHWAQRATASSFYGDTDQDARIWERSTLTTRPVTRSRGVAPATGQRHDPNISMDTEVRIDRLEKEMREMKELLHEMHNLLRKDPGPSKP